jgi:hypothetical protein
MLPFVGLGRYVNSLDDDELGEPAAAAYGSKPATPRAQGIAG